MLSNLHVSLISGAGTYVTLLGKSQFVTLHNAICSRAYGKSALLSCWVDLLHFDYIVTNVSHAPPPEPHLWNSGCQGVALRNMAPPP